jgi:hypothetical protein
MTGSQQGGMIVGFLAVAMWFFAAIGAIIGAICFFFSTAAGTTFVVLAAICFALGCLFWTALRRAEKRQGYR